MTLDSSVADALDRGVVQVQARLREASGSDALVPLALGPAGQLLVSAGRPATADGGGIELHPQRVGVMPLDGTPAWLGPPQKKPEEVWDGAVSPGWALWAQGSSTDVNHLDMQLWSHNETTGRTLHLASSVLVGGAAVSIPGYNRPVIAGDRAYWSDVTRVRSKALTTAVYSRALDGSDRVRVVDVDSSMTTADHCTSPASVVYVRKTRTGAQIVRRTDPGGAGRVIATVSLGKNTRVTGLASCAESVAYVASDDATAPSADGTDSGGTLTVLRAGKPVMSIDSIDGSTPADPQLSGHWLGLTTYNGPLDGGQWLVDLRDRAAYRLPLAQGLQQVRLRGAWVTWREAGEGARGPHTTVLAQPRD